MSKTPRILLLKAGIPAGARWITLHPNGPGTEGQPVLIQPNPDGSSHVIGGAGGKLNYLKLRGVKSESDYKAEAGKRKAEKAEAKKAKLKADKEAGIHESKKKAREALAIQQREHEKKFIHTVADTMGWNKQALEFPQQDYEHVSPAAQNKLQVQHHRELMKKATQAVDLQRERLVTDSAARVEAGIGEIPLDSKDPETISVEDLNPTPQTSGGLGFAADYKGRAEKAGLTPDDLKAEADKSRADKMAQMTDGQRNAAVKRGETAKMIREELKTIREPILPKSNPDLVDAKQAVELLRAQKALKQMHKQARQAAGEIERAVSEPKAYVLEYTADPEADAKITQDIDNDLRTAQTQAFLSEFHQLAGPDPTQTLGKHIGIGAYNSINSLALAVGGEALVDRSVVDVLGIAGAAQVLARRIHTDMPEDVEHITDGVQDFHLHHYMQASSDALSQARELMDAAKEVELGEAAGGADLQVAQELNSRRRNAVSDAQKILGQTLGEMEAGAALAVALKQGKKDKFEVSLGKANAEDAIRQVRAIGLQRGDYQLDNVGGDTFLTVNAAGLDRLAKPIERSDIEQVKRNLSIIHGDEDEEGWLPKGVSNRPDLVMDVKPGVAPRIAEPFAPGADLQQSLKDYIGGRAADGDAPGDIIADIQSGDFFQQVGADRADQYRDALDTVAPLKGEDGNMQRAEALADKFDEYADQFVEARHGAARTPLNRQKFDIDQKSVDALHRALSETPEGTAAYKQIGELTNQDQRTLREFFHQHVAKESPDAAALRTSLEQLSSNEPEQTTTDMFGDSTVNPEWQDWKQQGDELKAKIGSSSLTWAKYAETMRGHENAYESVQDLIRSKVSKGFADNYNKLNPGAPIKVGKAVVRNNLNHLDATDPDARDQRMQKERELVDGLRERVGGRYASGSVSDKLDAARDQREAFEQSQMGFFAGDNEDMFGGGSADAPKEQVLAGDERHTIGHEAERQIAGMMGKVGQNFKAGQPVRLWNATMSGGKNAARQRLVKMVDANKRVVAAFGTGSGKSLLQLAAFTHLHEQGKVKRGLFLVPSIVQGQFSGEALRYLEPGKFNWNIEPGASRDARIAAYKNPDHHFCVMTHQSFRDDMMHLGAKGEGISESEMSNKLGAMSDGERKDWMHGIMKREGINFDYLTVDESQNTLNRQGKENSGMANVVDALSHHTPYYLNASGDPVKNDASEVYDLMRKMDPARYPDRGAFMRRYGADTLSSKDALRREMARYVYPSKIDPDTTADRQEKRLPLSQGQKSALGELDQHFSNARLARMQGKVDVGAMKAISPASFDGVGEEHHENVARGLQKNLGMLKSAAVNRVINIHPDNPNVEEVAKTAAARKGKPGVVFAHNLEAVNMLKERLEREGHRVVTITGADSSKEKERKRLMFNPEQGEPEADIMVASDAGATGMNIQRGQWLYQYDTPQTAMTHAQRNGRIFRTGQKNNVELIDAIPDHPEVHKARSRLQKKYGLRDLMTTPLEGLDESGVAYYIKQRQAQQADSQNGLF
jgi:Helicase conserved C-terminal domain/Type III restriction enzyme, res subunit